eukprot:GSChrysophyteH1.ASY1.ANO1.864.1 assembled CDS
MTQAISTWYLDASNERGSVSILRSCGVSVHIDSEAITRTLGSWDELIPSHFDKEYRSPDDIYIFAKTGQIYVDVRDSGDCFLRCALVACGPGLLVKAKTYRRIVRATGAADSANTISVSPNDISVRSVGGIEERFSTDVDFRLNAARPSHNTRELVCELCRKFFTAGWVTGTGGSISIRHGGRIYMTPSGVQKERISPDELFVLDVDNNVLASPTAKPNFTPKLSDCSPLFLHAFKQRNAGAVLHSHALSTNLVTSLCEGSDHFSISHQEMIKGIAGHGYFDELRVPIIENTAHEHELTDALGECIARNPRTVAVLVRRHGIYVWGKSWEEAKRHGECLHYLFDVALNMHKMGMAWVGAPLPVAADSPEQHGEVRLGIAAGYKHVLFDIEGTTTPVTFVKDVLFPYSHKHIAEYLERNPEAAQPFKDDGVGDVARHVKSLIEKDSKDIRLKQLQGCMWKEAYEAGQIKAPVFADVPPCLSRLKHAGIKSSIYSSGSRQAQRLLFKHSDRGDLRGDINCYFDGSIGSKREKGSYAEICLSLGVDAASDVLFVTDIIEEAVAAKQAGVHSVISARPGNAPLPKRHDFAVISSFDAL